MLYKVFILEILGSIWSYCVYSVDCKAPKSAKSLELPPSKTHSRF